ncbi:MAG: hypothetical protein ACYDDV_07470 [Methanoregula sp.]
MDRSPRSFSCSTIQCKGADIALPCEFHDSPGTGFTGIHHLTSLHALHAVQV